MIPAQRRRAYDEPRTEPIPAVPATAPIPVVPAGRRPAAALPQGIFIPAQRTRPPGPDPALVRLMAAPPARRGRLAGGIAAVTLGAGLVAGAVVLLGVTGEPAAPSAEDAFVAAVAATPGLVGAPQREATLAAGKTVCARPDTPAEELAQQVGGGALGSAIVAAARTHLCP